MYNLLSLRAFKTIDISHLGVSVPLVRQSVDKYEESVEKELKAPDVSSFRHYQFDYLAAHACKRPVTRSRIDGGLWNRIGKYIIAIAMPGTKRAL